MSRLTNWLKKKPYWNILIAIGYYLIVVLPHEKVGRFLTRTLDEPLGRTNYNLLLLLIGIIGMISYLGLNGIGLKQFPARRRTVGLYLIITFIFIILAINFLMVVNVEMIHLVQYFLLAILLFPLFSSFGTTLFFTVNLGILDEAYQYWILTPFTPYYDFNDVIINMLGAALGLILLFSLGYSNQPKIRKWHQSPVTIFSMLLIFLLSIFYMTGILKIYPSDAILQPPLLLIRNIQPDFWTIASPNIKFHVLRPFWGGLIGILLFQFYQRLDRFSNQESLKKQGIIFKMG